jgi:presenilin-like A22 family membrane protease
MPDKTRAPRIPVAVAPAAVLLLCSLLYAAVVAIGDAPLAVLPALLIATAVYGVVAWYRTRHVGRQH